MFLLLLVAGAATGQVWDADKATFFMGRVRYSRNDGVDCEGVGRNMAQLVGRVSTVPVQDEQRVALTDPALFETPFLFMNGHNDFQLSDVERDNLRVYFEHGGFLFASGCCTNPVFPRAWRRELARIFPGGRVEELPYDHPIYRAFYTVDEIRCLHTNRREFIEALHHDGRLVAVLVEEGLCCAFSADNNCNLGRGITPEDGKKLALNIAVYAMTH